MDGKFGVRKFTASGQELQPRPPTLPEAYAFNCHVCDFKTNRPCAYASHLQQQAAEGRSRLFQTKRPPPPVHLMTSEHFIGEPRWLRMTKKLFVIIRAAEEYSIIHRRIELYGNYFPRTTARALALCNEDPDTLPQEAYRCHEMRTWLSRPEKCSHLPPYIEATNNYGCHETCAYCGLVWRVKRTLRVQYLNLTFRLRNLLGRRGFNKGRVKHITDVQSPFLCGPCSPSSTLEYPAGDADR